MKISTNESARLFHRAKQYIPGGVNSPVRAFNAVGGTPVFIERGCGSHIWDADGNEFIDYVCSWGPLILGHAHPSVVQTVSETAEKGTSFGASTRLEIELAEMLVEAVPSIEMVRLVNSGTEAVMSAVRLARGFTGRHKLVKFAGAYHGHSDALLAKAGSGAVTLGVPDSAGVPPASTSDTIVLPYNNTDAVHATFDTAGSEIACVLVEPVAGNMGVVPPKPGFLDCLRELTHRYDAVLIFDEIITGFRLSLGGAQEFFGVIPDMTTLGKIIGGGLPIGAYGGRRDIMETVAPIGPVYQAGTLSGNPIAVAAGLQTLRLLRNENPYAMLDARAAELADGIAHVAGPTVRINRVGSMMTFFFTNCDVWDYETAKTCNTSAYARFFHAMLERGIYLPPSQFEAVFLSTAHTEEDVAYTINAAREAIAST